MNTTYAWYRTSTNPQVWSLGEWDGSNVVNIQAQVRRDYSSKTWVWYAFIHSLDSARLPTGKAPAFENARLAAEQALQDAGQHYAGLPTSS